MIPCLVLWGTRCREARERREGEKKRQEAQLALRTSRPNTVGYIGRCDQGECLSATAGSAPPACETPEGAGFSVWRSGFQVSDSSFRVQGLGVWGLGFMIQTSRRRDFVFPVPGLRFQGSGFQVQGSGFRVQGSGFRVQDFRLRV